MFPGTFDRRVRKQDGEGKGARQRCYNKRSPRKGSFDSSCRRLCYSVGLANWGQRSRRVFTPILMGHWLRADSGERQISRHLLFAMHTGKGAPEA